MRLALLALTVLTLLIQGYHPLAEDGGLYVAGIEYTLNPTLFPHYTAFVTEHLRFSLFAPTLAALVHFTHLPLAWALFLTNLLSLWLTFYAARKLLQRCAVSESAQLAALCLLSVFWTLPIAGTSLYLMDPYVSARSLSTPLTLLAIAFALDPWRTKAPLPHPINAPPPHPANAQLPNPTKAWVAHPSQSHRDGWGTLLPPPSALLCLLTLLLAALFHPLMAAYALAFILILRATRLHRRILAWALLLISALALAAILQTLAPPESSAILAAERSRYYWFLSQWHWFELLGLAGPLIILTLLLRRYRNRSGLVAATLCRAALAAGAIAITICLLFAREDAPTHLVARLQPLRIFLPIYAIMTLLLGATLYQQLVEAQPSRRTLPALTLLALAATMFTIQRQTFPASNHIELPSAPARNPWVQAFLWARTNTPPNALFALDAKYVNEPGEDAQTFRAIALRSALPDFSKDGGEAAITPQLAALWQPAAAAQTNLSTEPDSIRDAHLAPFGATWMILHSTAPTTHPCPYDNATIKVCQLHP
jgi:hypothetical protein